MNTRTTGIILAIFLLSGCGAIPTEPPVYLPTLMPMPTHSPLPITETSTVIPNLTPPTETVALTPTNTQPIISTETVTLTQQDPTASPQTITCQVPQGWVMYTVQRNDTLSALSQRTGKSVTEIQAANCLVGALILAGQSLYLPFSPPPPTLPAVTLTATIFPTSPPSGPGDPTLTVTPSAAPPGTTFQIAIDDYPPNKELTVVINFADDGTSIFEKKITADENGKVILSFVSAQNAMLGHYNVYAYISDPPLSKFKEFVIETP